MEEEILEIIENVYIDSMLKARARYLYKTCDRRFVKVMLYLKYKFKLNSCGEII